MWNLAKKYKKYFSISLICLLMGVLISLSFKTYLIMKNAPQDTKNQTLLEVIDQLEEDNETLEKEVEKTRSQITSSSQNDNDNPARAAQMQKELDALQLLADQTEVSGPGIIISLEDNAAGAEAAKLADPQNYFPENFIIHDTDLRYLLNDIAYLAEAVAINGQRIISTSDIRCVGTVIMVNSTRLAPPYEISLIGSPSILEAALMDSQQYNYLKNKNMPVKITKSEELILPAYTGSALTTYLQPEEKMPAQPGKE